MCFDDLPNQREPEPSAAILPCGGPIELVERFENILQTAGWDSDACIGNGYDDKIFSFSFDGYHYTSTRRRELDSVFNKLTQYPGNLLQICLCRGDRYRR